jgi:hypothetical protein
MQRRDLEALVKEASMGGLGKALLAAGLIGGGALALHKLKKRKMPAIMGAAGGDDEATGAPAPTGNRAALDEAMKYGHGSGLGKAAKELSAKGRAHIKPKNFALPGGRYPINDKAHAANAKARAAQHASPEEKAKIDAAVARKYPGMGKKASVFRQAFLDEVLATGVLKVGHAHLEPFVDQSTRGVSQEDQQEYGHGKGMAKKKGKAKEQPSALDMAARKLASILSGSPMPAPAAAGAVLDDVT